MNAFLVSLLAKHNTFYTAGISAPSTKVSRKGEKGSIVLWYGIHDSQKPCPPQRTLYAWEAASQNNTKELCHLRIKWGLKEAGSALTQEDEGTLTLLFL